MRFTKLHAAVAMSAALIMIPRAVEAMEQNTQHGPHAQTEYEAKRRVADEATRRAKIASGQHLVAKSRFGANHADTLEAIENSQSKHQAAATEHRRAAAAAVDADLAAEAQRHNAQAAKHAAKAEPVSNNGTASNINK